MHGVKLVRLFRPGTLCYDDCTEHFALPGNIIREWAGPAAELSPMPTKTRKFLSEQLQLVLDELEGSNRITPDFLQAHLDSINEHAWCFMHSMPTSDSQTVSKEDALLR